MIKSQLMSVKSLTQNIELFLNSFIHAMFYVIYLFMYLMIHLFHITHM